MPPAVLALADQARAEGKLLPEAQVNLKEWLDAGFLPAWAVTALEQLVAQGAWEELNDRFFRKLAFGTGGMRGRTQGRVIAPAELGKVGPLGTPEHAAVGANNLNDFNLVRGGVGLFRYTAQSLAGTPGAVPTLVIAHDVRHFSRHFAELLASVWTRLGGRALLFDGPRSTPQLSFTVRRLKAHAGVNLTASHNPAHDNGFKCYWNDGAQVTPPHDSGVIDAVNAVKLAEIPAFLAVDIAKVETVPASAENDYLESLMDNALDKVVFAASPKIVYTNLHGTGDVMILPALKKLGLAVDTVAAQRAHDPRFPTVKSPNPENAEALALAVEQAKSTGADFVLATDPDNDRVGIAARTRDGGFELYSGNKTGTALAEYRLTRMKELGMIPAAGSPAVALVKTFVTTPLQDAIAAGQGVRCINTLTGFKWIGLKLKEYQLKAEAGLRAAGKPVGDYDAIPYAERVKLLQQYSTFFAFGGEESYGYLGVDSVRDKDGNAAAIMICELAAYLKKSGLTFGEYMDSIYMKYGFCDEALLNLTLEGAAGAARIQNILRSLRTNPPAEVDGAKVAEFLDFGGAKEIRDADGDLVPKENFYFFTLADGRRFAVRGSGTEPKIKFYTFSSSPKPADAAGLAKAKADAAKSIASLKTWLEADAHKRAVTAK